MRGVACRRGSGRNPRKIAGDICLGGPQVPVGPHTVKGGPAARHKAYSRSRLGGGGAAASRAARTAEGRPLAGAIGRAMKAHRGNGEDLAARFCHSDGVLELGRQLSIAGHRRPTIG